MTKSGQINFLLINGSELMNNSSFYIALVLPRTQMKLMIFSGVSLRST
jgi:hypothetical protein